MHLRLDASELAAIQQTASRQRMKPSEWVRWLASNVALGHFAINHNQAA